MARSSFRLYRPGGKEVLKVMSAPVVNALAHQIGGAVGEDAEVDEYTTDRAAAAVSVPAHQQASDGVLTRAASSAGLEVRAK